jgi:hypothetical protein
MVTEVGTGLGLLGADDLDHVLASRPPVMRSLSPEDWDQLDLLRAGGGFEADFHAAWENGRTFLAARDGLRGRQPAVVEWKGAIRAPGDEVAPIDLRVDHVYLISCKYLSNILFNVSPTHVFDHLLFGGLTRRSREATRDWYAEVAPAAYQALYAEVRQAVLDDTSDEEVPMRPPHSLSGAGPSLALPGLEPGGVSEATPDSSAAAHAVAALRDLPDQAVELTAAQRSALSTRLSSGWPADAKAAYTELSAAVAQASAARWQAALAGGSAAAEAMLWRLLRIGATPYFVLGSSTTHALRLRIATSWDWRQLFALRKLEVFPQSGGQPRVGWTATVRARASGQEHLVAGHVEVRWSHGRFGGLPEAKGYLDTAHQLVPGYFALQ